MNLQQTAEAFWDWVDDRLIIRRGVLAFTLYMTAYGVYKAWQFAEVSRFDGIGTAAVIAAILAPIAALQGLAFSDYTKGRI